MKIKKVIIQDSTFIHSDLGHAKVDKPLENKAKKGGEEIKYGQKVGSKPHFGYKFHNTI